MAAKKKTVPQRIGDAYNIANIVFKIAKHYGYVEVFHMSTDDSGQPVYDFLHRVDLTDDEKAHIMTGGTVILAHACGEHVHVSV